MNLLFFLLLQELGLEIGTTIGILAGVASSAIAVFSVVKTSRLKADTAQQEINFKTFEVQTEAKQKFVETELSSTQRILESWQGMSAGQAIRIEQIELANKQLNEVNNQCEVRCAKLEGKVEMLSTLQGATSGTIQGQIERQDALGNRQDRQETRQNTQEERQNATDTGLRATDMKVDKIDIHADTVEVKNGGDE